MKPELANAGFIPLIFASDITVYSLARAFHEAFGIVSQGYGIAEVGPLRYTRIINYEARSHADHPEVLARLVTDFAQAHADQRILPIGCGDNYVQALAVAQEAGLPENVCATLLPADSLRWLAHKQNFYSLCDQAGIAHPQTFVYREAIGGQLDLDFAPPFIVKPADSVAWWQHGFTGQRKVHLIDDTAALKALLSQIYAAGYPGEMIIQEFIPGPDWYLHVLTQYFDRAGRLVLSGSGQVLLEEHSAHGIGNSVVILAEAAGDLPEHLAPRLGQLLASLKYRGFASFDLKYDARDGQLKVLELNTRQGRGNYYVTGAGANVARICADDIIFAKALEPVVASDPFLWLVTPPWVARTCCDDVILKEQVAALFASGQWANPLVYDADKCGKRWLWLRHNARLQAQRYKDWRDSESQL